MNTIRESAVGYWVEIPDKVSDMGLSTHAFRLYIHLKKVTAEHDGKCYETSRQLAKRCNISQSSIHIAKKELVAAGLIDVLRRNSKARESDVITLKDI